MSIDAIVWAQDHAPVDDQVAAFVLNALARSADAGGRSAYPSRDTLMWRTRLSESSVKRALRKLRKEGLIQLGDQSLVAHIPADRRPTVWDLDMARMRPPRPVPSGRRGPDPADDGGPEGPPVDSTGGHTDRIGGSAGPERGAGQAPKNPGESEKSPLSRTLAAALRAAGVGEGEEERDFLEWIKRQASADKPIKSVPAYLWTCAANGDLDRLVADWRDARAANPKRPELPTHCGACGWPEAGDQNPAIRNPNFRYTNTGDGKAVKCPCHPDHPSRREAASGG